MKITKLLLVSLLVLPSISFAQRPQDVWFLPTELSDQNTKVRFEVDSTWHLVEGSTKDLKGKAKLTNLNDPQSVQIEISLPVDQFDTDNSSRDKKLKEVMHAAEYPLVQFKGNGLRNGCTPQAVIKTGTCDDIMAGQLMISGKMKVVDLPILISYSEGNEFHVSGKLPIKWAEYGVEDPSILIARVKPIVTIFFDLTLSASGS